MRAENQSDTGITNDERGNGTGGNGSCQLTSPCTQATTWPTSPRGQGRGGCAGAMSYYTAAGEPPGEWAGKGAAALGLSGQVDPDVIEPPVPGQHRPRRGAPGQAPPVQGGRGPGSRRGGGVPGRAPVRQRDRAGRGPRRRARQGPASGAVLRPDRQRGQERLGAARLLPGLRPARPASAATRTRPPRSTRAPMRSRPR